jgi:hypothetical protein
MFIEDISASNTILECQCLKVRDEGETKAQEIAALIRKRELEAQAAAQREAEKAAENQKITRGFESFLESHYCRAEKDTGTT